mgnify:CR=1 FL=1
MKRFTACMLTAAVAIATLFSLSSCKVTGGGGNGEISNKPLVIASFVDLAMDKPGTEKNPNLFYDIKQQYEKNYKSTVTFKLYNEQIFQSKLIQMIGAGMAPDLVYCGSLHLPRFQAMELLQPIDDYMDVDKINYKETADSLMWNGKHYAARVEQIQPYVIWYNKKIFQKNGLTEPYELWKKGEWNFDKFREVGMALTQDTNKDGLTDIYGFDTSGVYTPMWANSGLWVDVTEDGKPNIMWKQPEFYNALKFYQDAVQKEGWWSKDPVAGYSGFNSGTFAMIGEPFEFKFTYVKNIDLDQIGCAPWPEGPDFKKNGGKYYTACNILGIANRSQNPEGAAEFCKMMTEYEQSLNLEHIPLGNASAEAYLTEKDWEVLDYVRENALIDRHGWGEFTQAQWFYPIVVDGKDISTTLDSLEPVLKAEVEKTLSYKLPEIVEFKKPDMLTFEDGNMGYLTQDGCVNGGVSITDKAGEVLQGSKSLKISIKEEQTQQALICSDPKVQSIPGYHTYRINFDWKILSLTAKNKEVGLDCFVTLRPKSKLNDTAYQAGYIQIYGMAGDSSAAVGEVTLNSSMEDYALVLVNGDAGGGELVLDNIQITEINN